MKRELRVVAVILGVFLFAYFVPFSNAAVQDGVTESLWMLQEYARQHVLLCLVPAFFIAGAIAVFIRQGSVIKYLGGKAKKVVAYGVASISGAILAVCSCTVLPLFASIYKRGAGLGPAIAFLYSGPAINILAIILTGRILGAKFGVARAIGAVTFSVFIGATMQLLFRREESEKERTALSTPESDDKSSLGRTVAFVALMIGILVFANWGRPAEIEILTTGGDVIAATYAGETPDAIRYQLEDGEAGVQTIDKSAVASSSYVPSPYTSIYHARFYIASAFLVALLTLLAFGFKRSEIREWGSSTWGYAKLILPYLFGGVLIAGFLLGRPGHTALIPPHWISNAVGGNSWLSNFVASFAGALMYFATLTELPIVQGLMGSGMGDGPALALLLAGPALSLPNMLVIRKVLGTKKTAAYVLLVVIAATITGKIFGAVAG